MSHSNADLLFDHDLWGDLSPPGWEWTLKVSFLEVYNEASTLRDQSSFNIASPFEVLRDLLDNDGSNLVHVIKHDDAYGTMVTNVTSVEATTNVALVPACLSMQVENQMAGGK